MQLFYTSILTEENLLVMDERESHHLMHVLRAQPGDHVFITNGNGTICEAVINRMHHKHCSVQILSRKVFSQPTPQIHIAIAPVKSGDRLDFLLEKLTEIGATKITLLLAQNSERRKVNIEKEQLLLITAIKQSGRPFLPQLQGMTDFNSLITAATESQRFICHCRTGEKKMLAAVINPNKDVLICIGPEGDFSAEEITFATNNGFTAVTLGNNVLRTETAGIVACSIIQTINLNPS